MKKTDNSQSSAFIAKLLPLPLVLTMALFIVLMLGGLLFFMYSIVLVVALESAMVFLLIFAASMICFGLGALSLHGFFAYKKYYKNRINGFSSSQSTKNDQSQKTFKDYLTIQNISLVLLLVGAVLAIASAALGCMNRDKWTKAVANYMESNGYYAGIEYRDYHYVSTNMEGVRSIHINLDGKTAVVIYTADAQKQGYITINGYEKYKNQLNVLSQNDELTITEGAKPSLDGALEKMLFFMFDENKIENQVKIFIPTDLKDIVVIDGEYIEARN